MGGDPSAYAALGLEPDADAAAVDRAYKRLIKEHHPDREGGSATRAAERNRAYRDLRRPTTRARAQPRLSRPARTARQGRDRIQRPSRGISVAAWMGDRGGRAWR